MKYRYREPNEMKDSGVEWLGMIPKEWGVSKLKYVSYLTMGQSPESSSVNEKEEGLPFFQGKTEFGKINPVAKVYCNIPKKISNIGEILISVRAPVGDLNITNKKCCIGRGLASIKALNHKIYLYHLLDYAKNKLKSYATGSTFEAISTEQLKNLKIVNPSYVEQQKIAEFLDQKTSEFDSVIEKKEKLIERLEEAKKSLISEVVTGKKEVQVISKKSYKIGDDEKEQEIFEYSLRNREPHEMKDSGVEWLGMIPKEWRVKKSKYIFEIRKRISGELEYEILSITQKGIKKKDITTGGGQLSMDYSKYQIVKPGDFAMNHMDLLTGYVDVSRFLGVTSPDYRVFSLRDEKNYSPYFLMLLQLGYKNKIFFGHGQGSSQLGRWRFPTEAFNNFKYPYPNYEEQKIIANFFFSKTKEINRIIDKNKDQIEKIKEAKQSLISEAVTGKIEVL